LQKIEKALEITQENLRLDPKNNETKFELAEVLYGFATVFQRAGDERKHLQYFERAVQTDEEIYRVDSKNIEVLTRLVTHHKQLAELYAKSDNAEKASFHRQKSEDLRAKLMALQKN
jgi:tetratricopeptide (TPR) repeat protein